MPTKKTPTDSTPAPAAKTNTGSGIRTIGPAIPLAIALLHGALAPAPKPAAPVQTPTVAVSTSGSAPLAACGGDGQAACIAPVPMLSKGHPVNWWFVFKLNAAKFPLCGASVTTGGEDTRACTFGAGTPQKYAFGQQYAVASSEVPTLAAGSKECLGDTVSDPVGATFDEVYNGNFHYVVWNDQFYGDPKSASCGGEGCDSPWGHSKGMVAWNDAGDGMVMQVSTPSWPGSGSANHPRLDGNTLGCVKDDDVKVSQHFFALRLTKDDLMRVLDGLGNASVATAPTDPQIVNNGGPADVQAKVSALGGSPSASTTLVTGTLSSGVELISKPSKMHVPPWQMISSVLGGVPLRAATWWAVPEIPSTTGGVPGCWDPSLTTAPGAVDIATSGAWKGTAIGLKGGISSDANHAKIGVSTTATDHYAIFGDMNQQGKLSDTCQSSQNGRGGIFFVVQNAELSDSLKALITGTSAPVGQ